MAKKPIYYNKLESKKFENRAQAEAWSKEKKSEYKQAGISVKTGIEYGNDQKWEAKILPKV